MAIGKRIRFFRNRKGMTQKQLGELLGFLGKTSDVRMAQYESESRTPKQDLVKEMAHLLDVSPRAITVPEIDSYIGLMHTLFALEDMYGLKIGEIDGEVCLRLDKSAGTTYTTMFDMFHAWQEQAARLEQGERIVEVLKQNRSAPVAVEKQVAILYATIHDYLVNIKVPAVAEYEKGLYEYLDTDAAGASVMETIRTTGKLEKDAEEALKGVLSAYTENFIKAH